MKFERKSKIIYRPTYRVLFILLSVLFFYLLINSLQGISKYAQDSNEVVNTSERTLTSFDKDEKYLFKIKVIKENGELKRVVPLRLMFRFIFSLFGCFIAPIITFISNERFFVQTYFNYYSLSLFDKVKEKRSKADKILQELGVNI